uniref:Sulfotransferase n=1 Tax=Poecilia reticulata TaxID=8081 RepID=A0A3P9Q097_POERE
MTEADLYTLYKGVYVPNAIHTPESLKYYEEFTFRPDDVVIVTYPKSGERPAVIRVMNRGGGYFNVCSPWWWQISNMVILWEKRFLTVKVFISSSPSGHFSLDVVYVMRNPKDVFTSAFHYYNITSFLVKPGPQSEFLQKFLTGKVIFGSWFDHVKGWLNAKEELQIMYISYEDMIKQDLNDSVSRIAQFLGKPLEPDVLKKIADKCLFKNMKNNPMSNYSVVPQEFMDQTKSQFLRKGVAGDWRNLLTPEEAQHFDAVFKEKMKDVNFKFNWD